LRIVTDVLMILTLLSTNTSQRLMEDMASSLRSTMDGFLERIRGKFLFYQENIFIYEGESLPGETS
jgi:hypothetical protein